MRNQGLKNGGSNGEPYRIVHPLVHYLLGEREFMLFIDYKGGFDQGRNAVENVLRALLDDQHLQGVSLYNVSGNHDLLIRIWFDPRRLQDLQAAIQTLPQIRSVETYRVSRSSTPFQRKCDATLQAPMDPRDLIVADGEHWKINPRFATVQEAQGPKQHVRFFTLFPSSPGYESHLYERIITRCLAFDSPVISETFGAYILHSPRRSAVLLSAVARSWVEYNERISAGLLNLSTHEDQPCVTLFCIRERREDARPSKNATLTLSAPDYKAVFQRAARTLLNLDWDRTTSTGVRLEQITAEFDGDVARRLLTYEKHSWWAFIDDVRSLSHDILGNRSDRVLAQLMLSYIRMESDLHDLIIRYFRHPRRTQKPNTSLDREIMDKCKLNEHHDLCRDIRDLLQKISAMSDISAPERETLKLLLGKTLASLQEVMNRDTHIMLGHIPRILSKLRHHGSTLTEHMQFLSDPIMEGWETNIKKATNDRNLLMHGRVSSIFAGSNQNSAPWRELLQHFVLVYPQYKWVRHNLELALKSLGDDEVIPLPDEEQ